MTMRNVFEDLAAIRFPLPTRDDVDPPEVADEVLGDLIEETEAKRRLYVEQLRAQADEDEEFDPLLAAIADARADVDDADRRRRLLVAYGREIVGPPRHSLAVFGRVAGYSRSGMSTAYSPAEVSEVRRRIGLAARPDAPLDR